MPSRFNKKSDPNDPDPVTKRGLVSIRYRADGLVLTTKKPLGLVGRLMTRPANEMAAWLLVAVAPFVAANAAAVAPVAVLLPGEAVLAASTPVLPILIRFTVPVTESVPPLANTPAPTPGVKLVLVRAMPCLPSSVVVPFG